MQVGGGSDEKGIWAAAPKTPRDAEKAKGDRLTDGQTGQHSGLWSCMHATKNQLS